MTAALKRDIPRLLEAVAPPERRGIARDEVGMLVTDRTAQTHVHARFRQLPSFLRAGDLLLVNDSATVPAAICAQRENGEHLMLHVATMLDRRLWTAEPRGTVRAGEKLRLPDGASAVLIAPMDPEHPRLWYTWFQLPLEMHAYLARYGEPIRYGYITQRFPLADYQTMFANEPGSAEMPSAARPFTPRVVHALHERGVDIASITLHCGVASFEAPELPPAERYFVSAQTAGAVNRARNNERRVIAVGTTALRAIESATPQEEVVASAGWTDLIIGEDYRPKVVDALLTGFHDAAATHQWILRAFLGRELLAQAYALAAENGYYQHEFGDVHLIV
ncbi:MAG TPA: S-adenosylmethionine:tRNA ribosyltransferase-isomerase [Candidatus Baltobacteraceae bacterium]|nr:S-adenosylmethionine:tRNA ribosyltransferase-isomerase [Candidatus Baltobacteraceae bacterium]